MSQNNKKHDRRHNEQCQVCWIAYRPMDKSDPLMHRIECQICKASCHRVCYSPATTEKDFVCDVCLDNKAIKAERTDKKCILCHNDGLLKRIGDNIYGHPICLIRNPSVRLNLENTLQFETEKLAPKSSTKKQCSICSNACEQEEKCSEKKCSTYCHVYCYLKHENDRFNNIISPPEEGKIDKQKGPYAWSTRFLCFDQHHNWQTCICLRNKMQHADNLTEKEWTWIMCDGCRLWLHQTCIKHTAPKKKNGKFYCDGCKTWSENLLKGVYQQQNYPKMQYHDIFYLLWRIGEGKVPPSIIPLVPYNEKIKRQQEVGKTTTHSIDKLSQGLKILMNHMDVMPELNKNEKQLQDIMNEHRILEQSIGLLDGGRKPRKKQRPLDELTDNVRELVESGKQATDITLSQFVEYRQKKNRFRRAVLKSLQDMNRELNQEKDNIQDIYTRCFNNVSKARTEFKFHNWQGPVSSLVQFVKDPSMSLEQSLSCLRAMLDIVKMIVRQRGDTPSEQFMTQALMSKSLHETNILEEIKYVEKKLRQSPEMYMTNSEILQKQLDSYLKNHQSLSLKQYDGVMTAVYDCYPPAALPKDLEFQGWSTKLTVMRCKQCLLQPLSKHNYAYLQRKLEDWSCSKILPNQKFLRECNSYILQCELLEKLQKYSRSSEMDSPMDFQQITTKLIPKLGYLSNHVAIECSNEILKLAMLSIKPEGDFLIIVQKLSELYLSYRQRLVSCPDPTTAQELLALCDFAGCSTEKAAYESLIQEFVGWYNKYYKPIYQMNILNRLDDIEFVESNIGLVKQAVEEGENCRSMNIKLLRILKSLRLWMQLTVKALQFMEAKGKLTTYAAKELNSFMKESLYPKNKIMESVSKLASEANETDRAIDKFFSKKKKCEPFGQQKVVSLKPTQDDAQRMFDNLKNGKYDITFKYEDFLEEKKRFEKKVSHVDEILNDRSISDVQAYVKYFVHDCPFRYEEFKKLWELYIQLRCLYGTPKSKQQLEGLLLFAGQNAESLKRRFERVLDAYRQMDNLIICASEGRESDYTTMERLQLLQGDLLRDDVTLRTTIKCWLEGYEKARQQFKYALERGCELASLQQKVSIFKRFPIRYDEIREYFGERKDVYHMNISVLEEIMAIRITFSESIIARCESAIKALKSYRMLPKFAYGLEQDIEDYKVIKEYDRMMMGIEEYCQMLKICQKLNQQFATPQLNSIRTKRLFEFSKFATDSASTLPFLKLYYKEVKYLRLVSSMEQKEQNNQLAKIESTLEQLITNKQTTINNQNNNIQANGDMEVESEDEEEDMEEIEDGDSVEEMDDMDEDDSQQDETPSKKMKPDQIVIESEDDK